MNFDELQRQFRTSPDVFLRTLDLLAEEELATLVLDNRQLLTRIPDDYALVAALPPAYHRLLRTEQWQGLNSLLELEVELSAAEVLEDAIRINATLGRHAMPHYAKCLFALAVARIALTSVN